METKESSDKPKEISKDLVCIVPSSTNAHYVGEYVQDYLNDFKVIQLAYDKDFNIEIYKVSHES